MTILALVSMLAVHGCSLPGAAGIVANLQAESGLDPSLNNRAQIGLAQWQGPRRKRLLDYAGNRWRDPALQVAMIVSELREVRLWQTVCRAVDPGVAARVFMLQFERPRTRDPSYRIGLARTIYAGVR